MAKDTSTMKFGKQAPTFKVNPSVSAPHPQPAHAHHDHIRRDSVFLHPTSSLYLNDRFYTPNHLIKAKAPRTKKFGTQAPTFRVNPLLPTAQATGSFSVIQADQTLDIAEIKTNDALELGPHTWAYYQRLMTGSPRQNPYANLRYAPYPAPATRPTHGQAPSSAPFYSCSSSMPAANPTTPQYPRPSTVPTMAARAPQGPSAPVNPYPPSISSASLNPRPSRIPIMNPYPDSAATSPESISDLENSAPSPPAPPTVQNFSATTPFHSAPFSPEPVNDNTEVNAPPAKVEKKKFLTPRGCRWLRGVPADVYVRTEMASDKFVPATLDEEEEKAFDDFLDVDMIED